MPNQPKSPPRAEYLGSDMGPLDELFDGWLKQQIEAGNIKPDDQPAINWAKYVYYCACTEIYNTMMTVIKGYHTLKSLAVVSEAMRINIGVYMESLPRHTLN